MEIHPSCKKYLCIVGAIILLALFAGQFIRRILWTLLPTWQSQVIAGALGFFAIVVFLVVVIAHNASELSRDIPAIHDYPPPDIPPFI